MINKVFLEWKSFTYQQLYRKFQIKNKKLQIKVKQLSITIRNCILAIKNKGEMSEYKVKKLLFTMITNNDKNEMIRIFGKESSKGVTMLSIENLEEIKMIEDICEKSKQNNKADIVLKFIKSGIIYHSSIKSTSNGRPSIVNHTHRNAKVFKSGALNSELRYIDKIIKEYIEKRKENAIREDCKFNNLECIEDRECKNALIKLLIYFTFEGSGKGYSKIGADSIITIDKEKCLCFTICKTYSQKKEYIEKHFDKYILSLRSKGMPKKIGDAHRPWIYNDDNKKKGALHIRM